MPHKRRGCNPNNRCRKENQALCQIGSNFQATIAKPMSPRLPMPAPRASRAAAFLPRDVAAMPAARFFSVSCFSTSVELAGKIAGKARNKPPNTGPYRFARIPAMTVIVPPKRNRTAYSYHLVSFRAEMSKEIFINYRKITDQIPIAQIIHAASIQVAAAPACNLNFIMSSIVSHA
jgi:hypothetical protein